MRTCLLASCDLTWTPSITLAFPKTTSPIYFSFASSFEIVSRLHVALPEGETMSVPLAVRIPAWSTDTVICLNGEPVQYEMEGGYALLHRDYKAEDVLTVELDMRVRKVYTSNRVSANTGKAAIQRGPLIYCAEGVDNGGDVLSLSLKKGGAVTIGEYLPDKLYGIQELYAEGYRETVSDALYSYEAPAQETCRITLIPYYAWGNRGLNQMRVWLPEKR